MNRKRLMIIVAAAVLFVGLSSVGVILLMQGSDKTEIGSVNGTIGVNTVEKPDNLEECEFGIPYTRVNVVDGQQSGGGGYINVKNGRTVTFTEDENMVVELSVTRSYANSEYQEIWDKGWEPVEVFVMTLPSEMEWNLADALSTVDWSDDYFGGHEIETTYSCEYVDACNGTYYTSSIRVHCAHTIEEHNYWLYSVEINIHPKDQ